MKSGPNFYSMAGCLGNFVFSPKVQKMNIWKSFELYFKAFRIVELSALQTFGLNPLHRFHQSVEQRKSFLKLLIVSSMYSVHVFIIEIAVAFYFIGVELQAIGDTFVRGI